MSEEAGKEGSEESGWDKLANIGIDKEAIR